MDLPGVGESEQKRPAWSDLTGGVTRVNIRAVKAQEAACIAYAPAPVATLAPAPWCRLVPTPHRHLRHLCVCLCARARVCSRAWVYGLAKVAGSLPCGPRVQRAGRRVTGLDSGPEA